MIKVEQLSKQFGNVRAVDNISFTVKEHDNLVLLGTSGCGKTTTLKMINRLIEPSAGNIFIDGKNMMEQAPELMRRNIGYVLQNNGLFPHYTVSENIGIVPRLLKWDKKRIDGRIEELLEKLHLSTDYLNFYPSQLSGGQQQRVGLARALVADPPVLLMDEPFGALDNVTRAKIQQEFKALDELKRKTIIIVTHDVQEAFELGDHICMMDKGKIVQDGTPAQLLFNPKNKFVHDFLQDQRLQLEFKTITLGDVYPWLADINPASETKALPASTDFWTSIGYFKFHGTDRIAIAHPEKGEIKHAGFEQLMSAFYHYKNSKSS